MLTGSYDDLSANAPGPDVHVRFPAPNQVQLDQQWVQTNIICNIK